MAVIRVARLVRFALISSTEFIDERYLHVLMCSFLAFWDAFRRNNNVSPKWSRNLGMRDMGCGRDTFFVSTESVKRQRRRESHVSRSLRKVSLLTKLGVAERKPSREISNLRVGIVLLCSFMTVDPQKSKMKQNNECGNMKPRSSGLRTSIEVPRYQRPRPETEEPVPEPIAATYLKVNCRQT